MDSMLFSGERTMNILESQPVLYDRVQVGDSILTGMEYDPLCPEIRESGIVTFRGENAEGIRSIEVEMANGGKKIFPEGTLNPTGLWEIQPRTEEAILEPIPSSFQGDTILSELESFRGETTKFQDMVVNALGKMASEITEMKQSMGIYRGEDDQSFCSEFSEAYNSSQSKST
jgi:hypothetical protein